MSAKKVRRRAKAEGTRTQDPEGTRQNIIEIASEEFALNGLAGARIDEIAARTRTSKRMIYYYFGDKDGLYLSALENAYQPGPRRARASSTSSICRRSRR